MNVTFKRWDEICNDVKITYAASNIGDDEEIFIHVLHNDDAYVMVAICLDSEIEDSDLYVKMVPLTQSRGNTNYPVQTMPKYEDLVAALPEGHDLIVKE